MGVSSAAAVGANAGDALLGAVDGGRASGSGWGWKAAFSASSMETRSRSCESGCRIAHSVSNCNQTLAVRGRSKTRTMAGLSLTSCDKLLVHGVLLLSISDAAEVFLSPVGHGVFVYN